MARILHVTECYSGGVGRAIDTAIEVLSGHDHHLLWHADVTTEVSGAFTSSTQFPRGSLSRMRAVDKTVARIDPDLIVAHSSWAGLYVRYRKRKAAVGYQPHCYKFDDPNAGGYVRYIVRLVESFLSRNNGGTITLSSHESELARLVNPQQEVFEVPNAPTIEPVSSTGGSLRSSTNTILMVGRVSPQKDPGFLIAVAARIREIYPETVFKWVGDGEARLKRDLTNAGVEVTGWLSDAQLADELSQATTYFHSAQYEGFPLSVLDAAAFDVPVVVRNIPAFKDSGLISVTSPDHAAHTLGLVMCVDSHRQEAIVKGRDLLNKMNKNEQRSALSRAYEHLIRFGSENRHIYTSYS